MLCAIAIPLAMALPNSLAANAQHFSKEIALDKENYHLPLEAYEQRALYKLNKHILQKHVKYEFSWPAWIIEKHKEILEKTITFHLDVEIPSVSIKLKNKKHNNSQIYFTYDYQISSERVYSFSSRDVEEFIITEGSKKSTSSLLGLELFLAYPSIFRSTKQEKIERWEGVFSEDSKTLVFDLPIVSRKILERSVIPVRIEETAKSFEEQIAIFDLMPFNPAVCNNVSNKLFATLPVISERIQSRCPALDIQNFTVNKLNLKSDLKYIEVLGEIRSLVKETELKFEELPILTSIFNSLGTINLELSEFTEVSIQDLYGEQGLYFSIENFESNYSLDRLSIVSKQLSNSGYKNFQ